MNDLHNARVRLPTSKMTHFVSIHEAQIYGAQGSHRIIVETCRIEQRHVELSSGSCETSLQQLSWVPSLRATLS